jgi:hypothetical protein
MDIKEVDDLLEKFGFPKIEEFSDDEKSLIGTFLSEGNNPIFLLGLIMKLMKDRDDLVRIANDHFALKHDFNKLFTAYDDFRIKVISALNEHNESLHNLINVIHQDKAEIEVIKQQCQFIQNQYEEIYKFMMPEKPEKPPTVN